MRIPTRAQQHQQYLQWELSLEISLVLSLELSLVLLFVLLLEVLLVLLLVLMNSCCFYWALVEAIMVLPSSRWCCHTLVDAFVWATELLLELLLVLPSSRPPTSSLSDNCVQLLCITSTVISLPPLVSFKIANRKLNLLFLYLNLIAILREAPTALASKVNPLPNTNFL